MENLNFNTNEYRDNLAKDLKEIRKDDPEMAQKVIKEERKTIRYNLNLPPLQKEAEQFKRAEALSDKAVSIGLGLGGRNEEMIAAIYGVKKGDTIPDIIRAKQDITRAKQVENLKKYLEQKNVPVSVEKSITDVFLDGKMEINGEIVDTNIFSAEIARYQSERTVVITPKDLYIEIVPGPVSEESSYRKRFLDIPDWYSGGKGISTVAMKDGVGIVIENVNLFSKDQKFTEEQMKELNNTIEKIVIESFNLKEHCHNKQLSDYYKEYYAVHLKPFEVYFKSINKDQSLSKIFDKPKK